jgi:hypothetical protein
VQFEKFTLSQGLVNWIALGHERQFVGDIKANNIVVLHRGKLTSYSTHSAWKIL